MTIGASNGRVCANANCHHTELEHVSDMCWGKPKEIRKDGPTPGCRCNGFVARRDSTRVPPIEEKMKDQDKMDDRFVTAFERIAAALELISQKMPWPFLVGTTVPQPYVPYQNPTTICSSPNTSGTAVQPQAGAFQDLTEGRPMRVGTGG